MSSLKQRTTNPEVSFRVAWINTVGFLVASLSATFLDVRLTTHVLWGKRYPLGRTYPLGYYIACFAPAFFATTFLVMRKWKRRPALAAWLPASILAVPFLWNFRPELPHSGYILDMASYLLLSFLTVTLGGVAEVPQVSSGAAAPQRVNIRRLEEAIKDWRGLLFISTTTYVVLLIYWMQLIWLLPDKLVKDSGEKWILGNTLTIKALFFSLFVLWGPVAEIFAALKTSQAQLFESEASDLELHPASQPEPEPEMAANPGAAPDGRGRR